MSLPIVMADMSVTPASNTPAGTEAPTNADDYLRSIQAILRTTNAKGSDIASASTTDIGAATAEFVDVTGTTTITALGTIAAGIERTVRFTGALTLTYNATSLILPGAANITTANGDCAIFRSLGSGNWKCVGYFPQSGSAIGPFIDTSPIVKGSADATKLLRIEVDGFTTATTRVATPPDKDITLAGLIDIRSYLAGLTLSTAGSSATMSIAAGQCMDSTNVNGMTLAAISKTTSAWAVGTGNGGIDTGSIANSTWYYFYVIKRTDTNVVDVVFSLSSSSPTLPTNYTLYRYIGAGLTNGSAQWTAFTQFGDDFYWSTPVIDLNGTASTTAVTLTLSVPRGRKMKAHCMTSVVASSAIYLSDLANADLAANFSNTPTTGQAPGNGGVANVASSDYNTAWTNTSAQVRYRALVAAQAGIVTQGWTDYRDRML